MPNFTEIEETFCGRTDVRTYVRTDGRTSDTGFIRSTLSKSRPKNKVARFYGPRCRQTNRTLTKATPKRRFSRSRAEEPLHGTVSRLIV